jgi:hypothetical protein
MARYCSHQLKALNPIQPFRGKRAGVAACFAKNDVDLSAAISRCVSKGSRNDYVAQSVSIYIPIADGISRKVSEIITDKSDTGGSVNVCDFNDSRESRSDARLKRLSSWVEWLHQGECRVPQLGAAQPNATRGSTLASCSFDQPSSLVRVAQIVTKQSGGVAG